MTQEEVAVGVHTDQMEQVEDAAAEDATDGIIAELIALQAAATAAWITLAGATSTLPAPAAAARYAAELAGKLTKILTSSRRRARQVAAGAVVQAHTLAAAQAAAEVRAAVVDLAGASAPRQRPRPVTVPPRPTRVRVPEPARPSARPRPDRVEGRAPRTPEPGPPPHARPSDRVQPQLPDVDLEEPPARVRVRVGGWARTTLRQVGQIEDDPPQPADDLITAAVMRVDAVHMHAQERVEQTLATVPTVGYPAVVAAVREARKAAADVDRIVRTTVSDAASAAVAQVAERLEAGRVWIAERTACRHCLAYSGQTVGPGERFPGGLTFGDRPYSTEELDGPPLHPRCRCRTSPWSWDWPRPPGGVAMPTALRREAMRSILRGHRLESEPMAARVRAAELLLRQGPPLPKSVIEFAEQAVARGTFPPTPAGIG